MTEESKETKTERASPPTRLKASDGDGWTIGTKDILTKRKTA